MDIYSYINSRDVAAYCHEIKKVWSPFEMAVIIGRSERPLTDKHTAWREIIECYPDMPTPKVYSNESCPSLHRELEKIISYDECVLKIFKTPEPGAVYQYIAWNSVSFNKSGYGLYNCHHIFSTFQKTWADAMEEKAKVENEYKFSWYRNITVEKVYADGEGNRIEAFFDCDGNVYKLFAYIENEELTKFGRRLFLDEFYIDIPLPFKRGDILTYNSYWLDKKEGIFVLESTDQSEDEKSMKKRKKNIESGCSGDMRGQGFYVYEDGLIHLEHSPMDYSAGYDYYTTCYDNYEYYQGKLECRERILHYVSLFLKNEIGLPELLAAQNQITAEYQFENCGTKLKYGDLATSSTGYCIPENLLAENRFPTEELLEKLSAQQIEFLAKETGLSVYAIKKEITNGNKYLSECADIVHEEKKYDKTSDNRFNYDRKYMAKSILEIYGSTEFIGKYYRYYRTDIKTAIKIMAKIILYLLEVPCYINDLYIDCWKDKKLDKLRKELNVILDYGDGYDKQVSAGAEKSLQKAYIKAVNQYMIKVEKYNELESRLNFIPEECPWEWGELLNNTLDELLHKLPNNPEEDNKCEDLVN